MNIKEIDTLHLQGKIPDKYYYQLNERAITENYIAQKDTFRKHYRSLLLEPTEREELKQVIENSIEEILNQLSGAV